MSFAQCLVHLQAAGTIDAERAQRYRDEYNRLQGQYAKQMGQAAASQLAGQHTLTALQHQALTQRRQAMLQISTQSSILTALGQYMQNGGRGGRPGQAKHFLASIMEHHEAVKGGLAVDNQRAGLRNLAWTRMDDFLLRYKRDLLGNVRRGDELHEVVRALRGAQTNDPNVRAMAAAISDTMEWLRQQYNLAGGNIAKLADWGLPQTHDAMSVGKDFQTWKDFIEPRLDPSKMIDSQTGMPFATQAALDEALEFAWKNISSEGLDGQVPGAFTSAGKVANRRSDHRFLVFKDADAWIEYNERFGQGDAFDAITGHIDSMTRDIAAMQALGPNPALTVRWLGDVARQDTLPSLAGGKTVKLERGAKRAAGLMQDMWDHYSGAMTAVPPEYRGTARFFSGLRNWNVITKLGSAFLSALPTDPVFMGMTARFNGLPISGQLYEGARLLNPLDASHREVAAHAGLIFSEWTARAERMWREGQGFNVHELTRRGADSLLRISVLTPHTVAAKQAVGLGFMKDWAENAHLGFNQLDEPKRLSLERYGITSADWDALRGVGAVTDRGVQLLRPGDLARSGGQAEIAQALKFMTLIDSETKFAVPGESLRASSWMATIGGGVHLQRGTIGGELVHSQGQFKTYTAALMLMHLSRALYGEGGLSRGAYGLLLPTFLTFGGLLANWMIEIASGKDPSPIDRPGTWGRAFVRGGGAGVVGDLAGQAASGEIGGGHAVASYIAGPTISALVDPAIALTAGNVGQYARGEDTKFAAELVQQARNNVPGNTLWYTKAGYNRMWADQLQELADPHYRQSYRRIEQRAKDQGTQFFWRPGDVLPGRGPDLSNALGANEPGGPSP